MTIVRGSWFALRQVDVFKCFHSGVKVGATARTPFPKLLHSFITDTKPQTRHDFAHSSQYVHQPPRLLRLSLRALFRLYEQRSKASSVRTVTRTRHPTAHMYVMHTCNFGKYVRSHSSVLRNVLFNHQTSNLTDYGFTDITRSTVSPMYHVSTAQIAVSVMCCIFLSSYFVCVLRHDLLPALLS